MRLSYRLSALLVVCAAALPAAAADAAEPLVIDVSDFVPGSGGVPPDFDVGALFPHVHSREHEGIAIGEEEFATDDATVVADLQAIARSFAEQVDATSSVERRGRTLVVTGSAAARTRVSDVVTVLRRARGGPLRLEAEWLRLPSGTVVPDAPDAAALAHLRELDDAAGANALTLGADAGRWQAVSALREMTYVADVDVEIAQSAQIADPIVSVLRPGVTALVRATPLSDGRVLVRVNAARSELAEPLRRVALGQDELGAVELAELDAMAAGTELFLAPGRAAALVLERPGGPLHVLVLRLVDAPTPLHEGTLRVVPVAAFRSAGPELQLGADRNDLPAIPLWQLRAIDPVTRWDLSEVVDAALAPLREEIDEGSIYATTVPWLQGGALVLSGPADRLDGIVARITQFERELLVPAQVTLRIEERSAGGAARTLGVLRAPLLASRRSMLAAYRDVSRVVDYDVEVAENARISDPQVRSAIAGILADISAARAESGWRVQAELCVAALEEPEGIVPGALEVGNLERLASRVRRVNAAVRVAPGAAAEIALGASPFSATPARLVAVVEVGR